MIPDDSGINAMHAPKSVVLGACGCIQKSIAVVPDGRRVIGRLVAFFALSMLFCAARELGTFPRGEICMQWRSVRRRRRSHQKNCPGPITLITNVQGI